MDISASDYQALHDEVISLRQEVALLEGEQHRLRMLFGGIRDVLLVMDSDGRYLDIPPANPSLLYRPPSELLGKTLHEVMPASQADFFLSVIRRACAEGHSSMEYSLPVPDGEVWFQAAVSALDSERVLIVARDITDLKKAEAERERLREEVITMQQAALRELSTPLIPISEHIVVIPLIGEIDSHRAQQVIETLLEGVAERQADVAIIDITGVQIVDTHVADALMRAAKAARLLGALVILSGIRPEVAQTLVQLGSGIDQFVTRANLQASIAYALEHQM